MHTIQQFLDTVRIYGKPQTVKNYGFWLVKFREFVGKPVNEVEPADVARFIEVLRIKYAPTSVALATAVVKEYLRDYAPQLNTRRIRHPKAHTIQASEPLTPEEYVSMLSFIPATHKTGVLHNLIIRALYDSGARVGEIHQALSRPETLKEGYALIDTEKTGDKRYICWGQDTEVFLRLWLSFKKPPPSVRQMQRIVKKYATLANVNKRISCHSFRHTKAHLILDNGGTIKDIQETLGHRSPVSSFHYLRENENEKLKRQRRWIDK